MFEASTSCNVVVTQFEENTIECDICKKILNKKSLKRHKQSHERNVSVRRYNKRKKLDVSQIKKVKPDKDSNLQCSHCGFISTTARNLRKHKRRMHEEDRPIKCSLCPSTFILFSDFNQHVACHSKIKKYKCRLCPKQFSMNSMRAVHEETHGEFRYSCLHCNKVFTTREERRIHHRTHTKKEFGCDYCNKNFTTEAFKIRHEKEVHPAKFIPKSKSMDMEKSEFNEVRNCSHFSQDLKTTNDFILNDQTHSVYNEQTSSSDPNCSNGEKNVSSKYRYTCTICSKTTDFESDIISFISRSQLKRHYQKFHKERIHACKRCSLTYMSISSLKKHKLLCHQSLIGVQKRDNSVDTVKHNSIFECFACGELFFSDSDLNEHVEHHVTRL